MAEYLKGDAKYQVGNLFPVTELRKLPTAWRETKGTIFSKQYSNDAAIAAGGVWKVAIAQADIDEFMMFNRLRVINNSTELIQVRFNGSRDTNLQTAIPAQTMAIWGTDDKKMFQTVDIYNSDGLAQIDIGEITVNIMRVND